MIRNDPFNQKYLQENAITIMIVKVLCFIEYSGKLKNIYNFCHQICNLPNAYGEFESSRASNLSTKLLSRQTDKF